MVVCHCRAVSDGIIRHAMEGGACDVDSVARHCGAGSVCGGCRPTIEMLLAGVCPFASSPSYAGGTDAMPAAS